MKIFHPLLCYYPSQAGGPANAIYWLNNALDASVFSSEIITTQFGLVSPMISKEYSRNHKVVFLKSKGKSYIKKSFQELKTSDIVQFSSLFFPPTLPILFASILINKAVIISPRGELYQAAISQKRLRKKLWISVIKLVQTKIHFHATNDIELQMIQNVFPKSKSIVIIPNFIKMPKKQKKDIKMTFVFVGRINPIKNIHLLIGAIAEVHKVYPKVQLDIVGAARLDYEISYIKILREQIKENALEYVVCFRGHLDGDSKNEVIASSKALILPSKSENFGNVVLEALAQGTPVIASKNTPWKLLQDNNAGAWVDGNIKELTIAMVSLLNLNESTYLQIRKNAYELCRSKFDIKTNVNIWEKYYQTITTPTYVQK
jgi:glycosyltransferase involved in cell wall biosynthesis